MKMKLIACAVSFAALAGTAAADAPARCDIVDLTVYFQVGSERLTDAAQRALQAQAKRLDGCDIASIQTETMSFDPDGSMLTAAREVSVLSALEDNGIAAPFEPRAVSHEAGALDGEPVEPLSRRVDVRIIPLQALNS